MPTVSKSHLSKYALPCDQISLVTHETSRYCRPCSIHVSDAFHRRWPLRLQWFLFYLRLQLCKEIGKAEIYQIRLFSLQLQLFFKPKVSFNNNVYFKWMCTSIYSVLYYCVGSSAYHNFCRAQIIFLSFSSFYKAFVLWNASKEQDQNCYGPGAPMVHFNQAVIFNTHCCANFLLYYTLYSITITEHELMCGSWYATVYIAVQRRRTVTL